MLRILRFALLLLCASLVAAMSGAPPVELTVGKISFDRDGTASVEIKASAPLFTLGEGRLTGLLNSDPHVPWLCQFSDEVTFRCATPEKDPCWRENCSPEYVLPPASSVQLRIAYGALLAQSGAPVAGLDVAVETPRAALQLSMDGADALGRPRLLLYSAHALDLQTLVGRVVARQRGQEWPLRLELDSAPVSDEDYEVQTALQRFRFAWPDAIQGGSLVQVVAKPGLRLRDGPLESKVEQSIFEWLPPAKLEFSLECNEPYDNPCLSLHANTLPDAATILALPAALPEGMQLVSSQPALKQSGYGHPQWSWPLRLAKPNQRYVLRGTSQWRGAMGQPPGAREWDFRSGPVAAQWQIAPRTVLLPLGASAPKQMLEWVNQPVSELQRWRVDGGSRWQLTSSRLAQANSSQAKTRALGRLPRSPRVQGGSEWGIWSVPPKTPNSQSLPYHAEHFDAFGRAWADVGLHALVSGDRIHLIATDLYSAEPVAQVQFDLLELQQSSPKGALLALASATGDSGGRAELRHMLDPGRMQLLRAQRGRRTAAPSTNLDADTH